MHFCMYNLHKSNTKYLCYIILIAKSFFKQLIIYYIFSKKAKLIADRLAGPESISVSSQMSNKIVKKASAALMSLAH